MKKITVPNFKQKKITVPNFKQEKFKLYSGYTPMSGKVKSMPYKSSSSVMKTKYGGKKSFDERWKNFLRINKRIDKSGMTPVKFNIYGNYTVKAGGPMTYSGKQKAKTDYVEKTKGKRFSFAPKSKEKNFAPKGMPNVAERSPLKPKMKLKKTPYVKGSSSTQAITKPKYDVPTYLSGKVKDSVAPQPWELKAKKPYSLYMGKKMSTATKTAPKKKAITPKSSMSTYPATTGYKKDGIVDKNKPYPARVHKYPKKKAKTPIKIEQPLKGLKTKPVYIKEGGKSKKAEFFPKDAQAAFRSMMRRLRKYKQGRQY